MSARQMGKMLGNSMSLNVCERVLGRLLFAAGFVNKVPARPRAVTRFALNWVRPAQSCGWVGFGTGVEGHVFDGPHISVLCFEAGPFEWTGTVLRFGE